jgi:hypothetical protein
MQDEIHVFAQAQSREFFAGFAGATCRFGRRFFLTGGLL